MLKATPPQDVEDKIRRLAHKAGVPVTQFLTPFLTEIAEGRLVMHAGPPPGAQVVNKAA